MTTISLGRTTALAASLAGAGVIHVAMAPQHDGVLSTSFTLVGMLQVGVALLVAAGRARVPLLPALLVSLGSLGALLMATTVGLPFGDHAGQAEPFEVIHGLTAALELATVIVAGLAFLRPVVHTPQRWLPALAGVAFTALTAFAVINPATSEHGHDEGGHAHDDVEVAAGGHAHDTAAIGAAGGAEVGAAHEAAHEGGGHAHVASTENDAVAMGGTTDTTEAHEHATTPSTGTATAGHSHTPVTTPGGTVSEPTAGGGHVHECTAPVTADQRAAADRLLAETREGLRRWIELADAEADGFVPITPTSMAIVHYANPAWYVDGRDLDPTHPESLMYAFTKTGEPILLGAMYLMSTMDPGPPIGGCLTPWHDHTNLCLSNKGMVGVVDAAGNCPAGSVNRRTPQMLHVWGLDLPSGPFAESKPAEIRDALLAGQRVR